MNPITFDPAYVAATVGFIVTLILAYVPALNVWYAGLTGAPKAWLLVGLYVVFGGAIFALAHFGVIQTTAPIDVWGFLKVLLALIVTTAPQALPATTAVKYATIRKTNKQLGLKA